MTQVILRHDAPCKLTLSVMTQVILRHDAPCKYLLLSGPTLASVMTHEGASWRTIQNILCCPNQGLYEIFRHDAHLSVMTDYTRPGAFEGFRHDAQLSVTTDSAKPFCFEIQKLIHFSPSWRTNSASRRTVIVRHDAQLSVTTDSAKSFCFQFQRVLCNFRHDAQSSPSWRWEFIQSVMTHNKLRHDGP